MFIFYFYSFYLISYEGRLDDSYEATLIQLKAN